MSNHTRKILSAMRGSSLAEALEAINDLDEAVAVRGSNVEVAVRARVDLWCVKMRERAHARAALR